MLPTYTPALDKNVGVNRTLVIRSYFLQGFANAEIADFLALHHGIILLLEVKVFFKAEAVEINV